MAGEPLLGPEAYSGDRLFVHLRLVGDDNHDTDMALKALESAGHPVLRLEIDNVHDLGGLFYLWEMAVAIASSILNVNPFEQSDVQSAKDMTDRIIEQWQSTGSLPDTDSEFRREVVEGLGKGDYLALLAYVDQTSETAQAVSKLRKAVMLRFKTATTFGYGPRYLHSTGQLHKGGPNSSVFILTPPDTEPDLPIPGSPYTFGTLASAQASRRHGAPSKAANRRMSSHRLPDTPESTPCWSLTRRLEEAV